MRVIRKRTLEEFWTTHADAKRPLQSWHHLTVDVNWTSLIDVRQTFPAADTVGRLTVFNIKGNDHSQLAKM